MTTMMMMMMILIIVVILCVCCLQMGEESLGEVHSALLRCTEAINDKALAKQSPEERQRERAPEGSVPQDVAAGEEDRYESMCVEMDGCKEAASVCVGAVEKAREALVAGGEWDTTGMKKDEDSDGDGDGDGVVEASGLSDDEDDEEEEERGSPGNKRRRLVKVKDRAKTKAPSRGKHSRVLGRNAAAASSCRPARGGAKASACTSICEAVSRLFDWQEATGQAAVLDKCITEINQALQAASRQYVPTILYLICVDCLVATVSLSGSHLPWKEEGGAATSTQTLGHRHCRRHRHRLLTPAERCTRSKCR
jgi:hypothetical protein